MSRNLAATVAATPAAVVCERTRPMTRSHSHRSRVTRAGIIATSLAAAATATLTATAPTASSAVDPACPESFPVEEVARDQAVTGLTVDSGMTPEGFTGTVLGTLEDGIAPGLDMIMVRLTSAEIDRVGGIWAGMSGSPVYAEDGRLIGAVAYGLAGTTPVAGVTPAAAMRDLIRADDFPVADKVAVPRRMAARLVDGGVVTAREADGGMTRLPTPVAVSGLTGAGRLAKAQERLGMEDTRFFRAGAAKAAPEVISPEEAGIEPGGSLGSSLSYGDFSAVGIGTVTLVCGEDVVGFGHPMQWTGRSSMTMHGADTVYVQEDPAWVPFKVANPTAPVGTIEEDRLAGIAGATGAAPDTTEIESYAENSDTGSDRRGWTYASMPDLLPNLAALGIVANHTRVIDKAGAGGSLQTFTVTGTADGEPFTMTRANRVSSRWDIGYDSPSELYSVIGLLQNNGFSEVDVDSVTMEAVLDEDLRQLRIGMVELRRAGQWRRIGAGDPILGTPGGQLRMRVTLNPRSGADEGLATITRRLSVPVPATLRRGSAVEMSIGGGSEWVNRRSLAPESFEDLLAKLEARPRTDQVTAQLYGGRRLASVAPATSNRAPAVVTGGTFFLVLAR